MSRVGTTQEIAFGINAHSFTGLPPYEENHHFSSHIVFQDRLHSARNGYNYSFASRLEPVMLW